MALRWILALTLLSSLVLPVMAAQAQTLDQYGGYTSLPVPGGATGRFRVAKLGSRWVFATPAGNAFWMTGVFNIDVDTRFVDLAAKYAGTNPQASFGIQATKRLTSWGFNSVAEYSSAYVYPYRDGVVKMPALIMARPTAAGFGNSGNRVPAGGTYKDMIDALPGSYIYAARAFPDVFDPAYAAYVNAYMPAIVVNDPFWGGLATSPWCIGLTVDDADDIFGFGPGPEVPSARLHPHPSWYAVAASPAKASSAKWGQTYTDTKVYTKYALQGFLQRRYATIGALNTAWGSNYTTWDSAGGWGVGSGWLDEDGRHTTWLGTTDGALKGATAGVITDLDDFLYEIAHQYFLVVTAAGRAAAPNQLMWGPATLNGWGGLTRKQILQAAGVSLDVLNAMISSQNVADKTKAYYGDKPVVTWEGYTANPDSGMYAYPDIPSSNNVAYNFTVANQAARASHYASRMAFLLSVPTVAGFKFWAWQDSWSEKRNWGLTSLKDNAYDGVEARIAVGTNSYGFAMGGEDRNHGNFLSYVMTANATVAAALGADSGGGSTGGGTTPSTLSVAITAPTSGSTVQQSVTVSATASSTAARINLILDGSIVAMVGGSTATYSWDTTTSPNGTHTWTAKAYDASGNSVSSTPIGVVVQNSAGAGDTTTVPAKLTLTYSGMLRDRVGQGNTALAPDGAPDGTLTVMLSAPGGRTITGLRLDSDAPGTWDTSGGTAFWVLAVAPTLDGTVLNAPGTMAVTFSVADGGSFVVFASDYQASEFLPGRTLTLTATFADGSTAAAVTTVAVTGPATLTLVYNGMQRDRVGQGNTALAPDGALDGTLTVMLSAPGGRTVTGLRLDSDAPGIWDTASETGFWALAVAPTLDGAVLNAPGTMAVNFPVADGGSFVVFAADYQGTEFLPGRTLTLTATFADGSTATAVTTVAAPGPATLTLTYNGMQRDRVGQGNTALAPDGALDGTLTAMVSAAGGRTVTGLRLDGDAPGIWDTTSETGWWALGVATTLEGALLNAPGTMAMNFPVADGGSFVLFASDYQGTEFLPGRTLTLTATFADGSTATAVTTVP